MGMDFSFFGTAFIYMYEINMTRLQSSGLITKGELTFGSRFSFSFLLVSLGAEKMIY
jgi:hypothetical protein